MSIETIENLSKVELLNSDMDKEINFVFNKISDDGELMSDKEVGIILGALNENINKGIHEHVLNNTSLKNLHRLFNETKTDDIKRRLFEISSKGAESKLKYSERNYTFNLLKFEARGIGIEKVKKVQGILGVEQDGDFGPKTFAKYIEVNRNWEQDSLEKFILSTAAEKEEKKLVRIEFTKILGNQIENLNNEENIKIFFEKSSPEKIVSVLEFIEENNSLEKDILKRSALEDYLYGIYKKGIKLEKKGELDPTFFVKENISNGDKRAILFYSELIMGTFSLQSGLFSDGVLNKIFEEGKREKDFNLVEQKFMNTLKAIDSIKKDILSVGSTENITEFTDRIHKQNEVKYRDKYKLEKREDAGIRENILDILVNDDKLSKENISIVKDVLRNKVDLNKFRIDVAKLTLGDLKILREQNFYVGGLFLKGLNGEIITRKNLKKGLKMVVDFGGNKILERYTGMGDLFIDPYLDGFQVTGVKARGKIGKLSYGKKIGYFNNGKYLPVFSKNIIEITEIGTAPKGIDRNFENDSLMLREEDFKGYLKSQILEGYGDDIVIRPLSGSKIDIEIFRSSLEKLGYTDLDDLSFVIKKENIDKFEKDYLNIYNAGTAFGGIFKSITSKIANKHFGKNSRYGSYIARTNAMNLFNVSFTRGDADMVYSTYITGVKSKKGVLDVKQFNKNSEFTGKESKEAKFFDIFLKDKDGKIFRVAGYRNKEDGEIFILDPYFNSKEGVNKEPIPLKKYLVGKKEEGIYVSKVAYYGKVVDSHEKVMGGSFFEKLNNIAGKLKMNPEHLAIVIAAESKFRTDWANPYTKAVGLIQFMPSTAKGLGTTVSKIAKMSAVEQLDLVYKYFKRFSGKLKSVVDVYKAVFFPVSLNHKNKSWVLKAGRITPSKLKSQNKVIAKHSTRADGYIDGYAFEKYVNAHIRGGLKTYKNLKKNNFNKVEKYKEINDVDISELKKLNYSSETIHNVEHLNSKFRKKVIRFLIESAGRGYKLNIRSGYRSIAEQKKLMSYGKKTTKVTKASSSRHTHGKAIDVEEFGRTGKKPSLVVKKIAAKHGLWNGAEMWDGFDPRHFQDKYTGNKNKKSRRISKMKAKGTLPRSF